MLKLLKHIWLGVALIVAASSLLLISDMDRRQAGGVRPARRQLPRLAVFQWVSTDLLDHTVEGIVEGLRRHGFEHGRTADIRFFNASGDNATGNALAREVVGGTYDMVLTASTLALQAVAQANAQGRVPHVFGGVTDPYGAGVGITGPAPDQHPPHLTGVGTFQPVERAIQIARRMNPGMRRIGVVWNPGESNSEACVIKARAICAELGIELIEANAGAAPEVPEAVRSVLARRAESIWVGGDTVAISAIGAIVSAARAERIPVFSNDPSDLARGVLFSVGASYREVGIAVGEIGGKILNGASPASFGVRNLVPERWAVNEDLAADLEGWSVPEDLRGQPPPIEDPARPWEIRVIRYNDAQFSADTHHGIMDGFKRAGLREGVDFKVRCLNAQGDMTTLASIMTAVRAEQPDLVMPISTPALQAALRQAGPLPMVFSSVGDGVRAGAGTSEADHLPNVTGITTRSPFEGMARLIRESVPRVRAVGTLFSPAEINSELYREWFAEALKAEGLELVSVPVTTSADIAEATTALLRSDIQLVAQISDNTTRPGFAQIVRRSRDAGIPFFCFDSAGMSDGATLSLARDYYENGVEAAAVAIRVLRGESPGGIPFTNTRTETLAIHPDRLKDYTITLSPDLLRRARVEPRASP